MSFDVILPFLRPIAHLIQDPAITRFMVNGSGPIFVEREGRLEFIGGRHRAQHNLRVAVRNLARVLGDDISENNRCSTHVCRTGRASRRPAPVSLAVRR